MYLVNARRGAAYNFSRARPQYQGHSQNGAITLKGPLCPLTKKAIVESFKAEGELMRSSLWTHGFPRLGY